MVLEGRLQSINSHGQSQCEFIFASARQNLIKMYMITGLTYVVYFRTIFLYCELSRITYGIGGQIVKY